MSVRKPGAAPVVASAETPNAKPVAGQPYRIVWGDTLSAIALATYGKASMWPAIKAFNEGKVGPNELILAGDTLKLPTAAEAQALMAKLTAAEKKPGWNAQAAKTPTGGQPAAAAGSGGAQAQSGGAGAAPGGKVQGAAAPTVGTDGPDLTSGLYRPPNGTTARKVIADAFGIRPEEVGPLHAHEVAASNPGIKPDAIDQPLAAGATVQLTGLPQTTRAQLADVQAQKKNLHAALDQDAALPAGAPGKLSDAQRAKGVGDLDALTKLGTELQGDLKRGEFIGQFGAMQVRTAQETSLDGIKKAYAPFAEQAAKEMPELLPLIQKGEVDAHQAAAAATFAAHDGVVTKSHLTAAQALIDQLVAKETNPLAQADLLRTRAGLSMALAEGASISKPLVDYAKTNAPEVSAEKPLPAPIAAAVKQSQADIAKALGDADNDMKKVEALVNTAITNAKDPAEKARLQKAGAEITAEHSGQQMKAIRATGSVAKMVNDPKAVMAAVESEFALRLGLDPNSEPLKPTVTEKLDSSEKKAWYFGTEVHTLAPAQLKVITDKLAALPQANRDQALEVLANYAQTAADLQRHSGVSVASQVLTEAAKTNPRWALEAQLAHAGQSMTVGALKNAEAAYQAVLASTQTAEAAKDPATQDVARRAVVGKAAVLLKASQEGDASLTFSGPNEKEAAGLKLTAFREQLEAAAAGKATGEIKTKFSPEVIADVNINEVQALLVSLQPVKAEAALKHLKEAYGTLPRVPASIKQMESQYRTNPLVAFGKSMAAEGVNNSGTDMAMWAGGGAAATTIAFYAGVGSLIPLPGLGTLGGALFGGAMVGLGAMTALTMGKGLGHASEAYSTRLSAVEAREAALGAAAAVGSFVGLGAPGAMLAKIGGKPALKAAALGLKGGDESVQILKTRVAALEKADPTVFKTLVSPGVYKEATAEEKLLHAQKAIQHDLLNSGMIFGAKTQGATMGVQGLGLLHQWYQVAYGDGPEEEKNRQLQQIHQQLAVLGVQAGVVGGVVGDITRGIYRGTPAEIRTALKARIAEPNTYNRTIRAGEELDFEAPGKIQKVKLADDDIASTARTDGGVRITGQKAGTTTVDIKRPFWGKDPSIKVNVKVLPSEAEAAAAKALMGEVRDYIAEAAPGARTAADAAYEKSLLESLDARIASANDDQLEGSITKKQWAAARKALVKAIEKTKG